jgi:hypothetical protein
VSEDWEAVGRPQGFIRIQLRLRSTSQGGRTGPIRTGYRTHWDAGAMCDGEPMQSDAAFVIEDADWLAPGETAEGRIYAFFPERWSHVKPGTTIHAYEGSKRVGTATVLELVPPIPD